MTARGALGGLAAALLVAVGLTFAVAPGTAGAAGTTYFVSPTGTDTTCAGNSQANPFPTIQDALACAVDGDTVSVAASGATPYPGIGTIDHDVTISAQAPANARSVVVDVSPAPGPMTVSAGSTVTLSGLSLVCEAGFRGIPCGPDVINNGTLTLDADTVTGTLTDAGILNESIGTTPAVLDVQNSSGMYNLNDSTAPGGGGIRSQLGNGATAAPSVNLYDSTVAGNQTTGSGGGVYTAGSGATSATVTAINSTITANNAATFGGGISATTDTVSLSNTIVAANAASTGGPDCSGALSDGPGGHNLLGDDTACTGSPTA